MQRSGCSLRHSHTDARTPPSPPPPIPLAIAAIFMILSVILTSVGFCFNLHGHQCQKALSGWRPQCLNLATGNPLATRNPCSSCYKVFVMWSPIAKHTSFTVRWTCSTIRYRTRYDTLCPPALLVP